MKLQRSNKVERILQQGQDAQEAAENNPKGPTRSQQRRFGDSNPLAIVPSSYVQPSLAVSWCVFEMAYIHLRNSRDWARPNLAYPQAQACTAECTYALRLLVTRPLGVGASRPVK
jgi:hypothetical protein